MHSFTPVFAALLCCYLLPFSEQQYTPDWTSIDSRPLPAWYDESKIGIFIHWGVFSVPSIASEWYVSQRFSCITRNILHFSSLPRRQHEFFFFHLFRMWWDWKGTNPSQQVVAFMNRTYPPDWTYADFAAEFRAEFYGK
jgi:alpha-L-fucosidase